MSKWKTEYIICLYLINNIRRFLAGASYITQVVTPPACKLLNFFI